MTQKMERAACGKAARSGNDELRSSNPSPEHNHTSPETQIKTSHHTFARDLARLVGPRTATPSWVRFRVGGAR